MALNRLKSARVSQAAGSELKKENRSKCERSSVILSGFLEADDFGVPLEASPRVLKGQQ